MPRDSSGNYALPSGNPVISGSTISSNDFNNTMTDIGDVLQDSLSRSGDGGMQVALKGVDGTNSIPAFSFSSDPDTGLYRPGTNQLSVALAGGAMTDFATTGLTIRPADVPDLTDGTNSLNVGVSSGQHIAMGGNDIQSKSDATTAAALDINPLGGLVNLYGGSTIVRAATAASGILALRSDTSTDTEVRTLSLQHQDGTVRAVVGHTAGNSVLNVINNIDGGTVSIQATDTTAKSVFTGDPAGAVQLFQSGSVAVATAANGMLLRGSGTADPTSNPGAAQNTLMVFQNQTPAQLGSMGWDNSANFVLRSEVHGGTFSLQGQQDDGTTVNYGVFDPDGSSSLYQNASIFLQSRADGVNIRSAQDNDPGTGTPTAQNARIVFSNLSNETSGSIGFIDGDAHMEVRSQNWGGELHLSATDSSGNTRQILQGNPLGTSTLVNGVSGWVIEHNGTSTIATNEDGIDIRSAAAGSTTLNLAQAGTTTLGALLTLEDTTDVLSLENRVNSGNVQIIARDSVGGVANILNADPDGDTDLYSDAVVALRIKDTLVQLKNTVTGGGLERGLTKGGDFLTYHKAADESVTSSTSIQSDNDLDTGSTALEDGSFWAFELMLRVTGNSTGDFKWLINTSGGADADFTSMWINAASGGTPEVRSTPAIQQAESIATTIGQLTITGFIEVSGADGGLTFQWAQNTSNATATIVKAGSWLKLTRLSDT